MNWEKVTAALDEEWHRNRQLAELSTSQPDHDKHMVLAQIALLLRDALHAGLVED